MLQYLATRSAAIRILKTLKNKPPKYNSVLFLGNDSNARYVWETYENILKSTRWKSHTVDKAIEMLHAEQEIEVLMDNGKPYELKMHPKGDISFNDRKYHFQIWDIAITYYLPFITIVLSIVALWQSCYTQFENARVEQRIDEIERRVLE